MESKKLVALLSSVVSELLVLVLLLFPAATPLSVSSSDDDFRDHHSRYSSQFRDPFAGLLPLVGCFLARFEKVSNFPAFSRKRKRTRVLEYNSGSDSDGDKTRSLPGSRLRDDALVLNRNPDFFVNSFRMTSCTFEWLVGLLEPLLDCRDPAGSRLNLSAELRLGIGILRLATGGDYGNVSRQFGVSESTARFCTKHLCRVLCTNFRFWVGFPGATELKAVSKDFESVAGLPNCCGAIGLTRFGFSTVDGHNSIATQVVVDSSFRILSIVAGFRGQGDESKVLQMSSLYEDVEGRTLLNSPPINVNGASVGQYLVGVGGYPLLPWIMVPFAGTESGPVEGNFNLAHNMMCLPVHKTIASLKNWGVLSSLIDGEDFRTVVAFIGACSILHNALLMREDYSALFDGSEDSLLNNPVYRKLGNIYEEVNPDGAATAIRRALASKAHEFHS